MNKAIKLSLIPALLLFLSNCQSSYSSDYSEKKARPLTEAELKAQLLQKECNAATTYLDGTLKYTPIYKGPLSMKVKGLKITCNISNKAILATFKDIKTHIQYTSKTGAKILEKDFDIYEFIAPSGTITYKSEHRLTNQQYKDIAKYNWTIEKASCK